MIFPHYFADFLCACRSPRVEFAQSPKHEPLNRNRRMPSSREISSHLGRRLRRSGEALERCGCTVGRSRHSQRNSAVCWVVSELLGTRRRKWVVVGVRVSPLSSHTIDDQARNSSRTQQQTQSGTHKRTCCTARGGSRRKRDRRNRSSLRDCFCRSSSRRRSTGRIEVRQQFDNSEVSTHLPKSAHGFQAETRSVSDVQCSNYSFFSEMIERELV